MEEEKDIPVNNAQLVANCDQLTSVENKILTIRDVQVILDRDLADLYNVETKRLNEQVRRNILRFPKNYNPQNETFRHSRTSRLFS